MGVIAGLRIHEIRLESAEDVVDRGSRDSTVQTVE
jgi:hypothetical protein